MTYSALVVDMFKAPLKESKHTVVDDPQHYEGLQDLAHFIEHPPKTTKQTGTKSTLTIGPAVFVRDTKRQVPVIRGRKPLGRKVKVRRTKRQVPSTRCQG